jgi:hypothetical protein
MAFGHAWIADLVYVNHLKNVTPVGTKVRAIRALLTQPRFIGRTGFKYQLSPSVGDAEVVGRNAAHHRVPYIV